MKAPINKHSESVIVKKIIDHPIDSDFVFENKISDHKPIMNEGILSWNIMMQGRQRNAESYNNGFRIVETKQQYQDRLILVAYTLAEIISLHPEVTVIALQEAPITPDDIAIFTSAIAEHAILAPFAKMMSDKHLVSTWGLMTLVDNDTHEYKRLLSVFSEDIYEFNERAHTIRIYNTASTTGYTDIMNIHIPYRLHNQAEDVSKSIDKLVYAAQEFVIPDHQIVCGDINVNPKLLSHNSESVFSKPENNIQSRADGSSYRENVDAIMRVTPSMLTSRFNLFQSHKSEGYKQQPILRLSLTSPF